MNGGRLPDLDSERKQRARFNSYCFTDTQAAAAVSESELDAIIEEPKEVLGTAGGGAAPTATTRGEPGLLRVRTSIDATGAASSQPSGPPSGAEGEGAPPR
jgi:hypothetical protein